MCRDELWLSLATTIPSVSTIIVAAKSQLLRGLQIARG
jgi:hypothetical protein